MRAAALLAGLLVAAPGLAVGDAGERFPDEGWRVKADAALLAAYDDGQGPLRMVVAGPRMEAPAALEDRDAWRAHWAAQSAPFLAALRDEVERLGGRVRLEVAPIRAAFVEVPSEAVPRLLARGDVRLAGLDWEGAVRLLDGQGPGIDVELGDSAAKVQAQDLWALGFRGEDVRLAVLDTGVRSTHEMMKRADGTTRVAKWFDATGACANPCDGNGHGTHTTSTAAGSNLFNSNSPQGVAPRATIFGIKVLSDGGGGNWEDAQEGLQKAFDLGAEVTSNSWGGGCGGGAITTAELAETLTDAGMASVFAAGNDGPGSETVHCPGLADKVLTVGAIDINEGIASFSGRGPCTWMDITRVCPDVVAVGVAVRAAWSTCDTCYAAVSGTSMSTPHIAGVVALLQQAAKALRGTGLNLAAREPESLLRHTAKDLGFAGIDDDYGWGLAKAKAAYDVLAAPLSLKLDLVVTDPPAVMHAGQKSTVTFALANLGGIAVEGRFTHTVEQLDFGACPPSCDVMVLADRDVELPRALEAISHDRFAGAEHPPGNYRVTGRLSYTYVDPADGLVKSGEVLRTKDFLLKKVVWQHARLVPSLAKTGDVLLAGLSLRNVGNENAGSVKVIEEYNAKGYAPVPVVPPGLGPFGLFANPSPSLVSGPAANLNNPKMRYEWQPGTIGPGPVWGASFNFAAAAPGNYAFVGRVEWADEVGQGFGQFFLLDSAVALPA